MAASIDLEDLVPDIKTEVNYPGSDAFPNSSDVEWKSHLRSGFWDAVMDGTIIGYEESDGIVTPKSGDTALDREFQQLIIFYAGMRIIRNQLLQMKTMSKYKAGPVEYEVQQSAQVLKGVLDMLTERRNIILTRLSDIGSSKTTYIDMVISRDIALNDQLTYWMRG
jgi:hypothetical protein